MGERNEYGLARRFVGKRITSARIVNRKIGSLSPQATLVLVLDGFEVVNIQANVEEPHNRRCGFGLLDFLFEDDYKSFRVYRNGDRRERQEDSPSERRAEERRLLYHARNTLPSGSKGREVLDQLLRELSENKDPLEREMM